MCLGLSEAWSMGTQSKGHPERWLLLRFSGPRISSAMKGRRACEVQELEYQKPLKHTLHTSLNKIFLVF